MTLSGLALLYWTDSKCLVIIRWQSVLSSTEGSAEAVNCLQLSEYLALRTMLSVQ